MKKVASMFRGQKPEPEVKEVVVTETKSAKEIVNELRGNLSAANKAATPYRKAFAPTVTLGALWGGGTLLEIMPDAWNAWMYPAGLGVAVVGASLARPVVHWLRENAWLTENTPGNWWARVSVAAGTGWLAVASATGVDDPEVLALGGVGLALSVPWWLRNHETIKGRGRLAPPFARKDAAADGQGEGPEEHRAAGEGQTPEEREQELLGIEASSLTVWETQLAAKGGPFEGCELDTHGWERTEYGDTAAFWLPRTGTMLADEAISKTLRILTMLRKQAGQVQIEPHPDCIEGHLLITLMNRLPVEEGRIWAGPNLDPVTGIMPIGLFADGKGEAKIRLFKPGFGMKHLLISGGTGAGKTYLVSNVIAAIEHSGIGVAWLADPQGGASLPEWSQEGVLQRVALDGESIAEMIRAAYNVMMSNSELMKTMEWIDDHDRVRKGRRYMEPSAEMPFLALVIEEAHMVLKDPEIAKMVGLIAKMGRKAGVVLVLITQTPTQEELGGSQGGPIRDNVLMGNIIVLRTKSRMTQSMLSLPVDPNRLPESFPNGNSTEGIGFVVGEGSRNVMMRADFDKDPFHWVITSPHTKLHESAEEAAMAVFDNPGQTAGGDGASAPQGLPGDPAKSTSLFDGLPGLPFPEVEEEEKAAAAEERREAKKASSKIKAYIRKNGPATPTRLAVGTGYSGSHIHRVLLDLVGDGELENDGGGVYSIAKEAAELEAV